MNPVNRIFIRVATEDSRTITLANGKKIFFDDSYNENWHRQQIGQAVYVPEEYTKKSGMKNGDMIYFHHLATIPENKITIEGETLYMQPLDQIFAVKKGKKITCLGSTIFVEQAAESEGDIKTKSGIWLKEKAEEIKREGIVVALPPDAENWVYVGKDMKFNRKLSVGCRVIFKKGSEYQINADFGKRKVYKMKLENILAVLD